MADFSVQDAAFTGFRVAREHPKALVAWAAASILIQLAVQGVMIVVAGRAMTQMMALYASMALNPSHFDPRAFSALAPSLLPAYGVIVPISLAFSAVLYAAMNRVVLPLADEALGYFRVGADEARQLGLRVLLLSGYSAVGVVGGIVIGLLAVMAGPGAPVVVGLGVIAGVCGLIFLMVRLSLASPLTFQSAKIDVFGSWALTQGRFWPILGTYAIAAVMTIVVALLSAMVIGAVSLLLSGGHLAAATSANYWTLAGFLTPARLVTLALNAALGALLWPIMLTPAIVIYQHLGARHGAGAADAFS